MRLVLAGLLSLLLVASAADAAFATGTSGKTHHHKSHHHRSHHHSRSSLKQGGSESSHALRLAKTKVGRGNAVRHCKTEACMKKHPSGSYNFNPAKKKHKN